MLRRSFIKLAGMGLLLNQMLVACASALKEDKSFFAKRNPAGSGEMDLPIETWVDDVLRDWKSHAVTFQRADQIAALQAGKSIAYAKQLENTRRLSKFGDSLEKEFSQVSSGETASWVKKTKQGVYGIAEEVFGLSKNDISQMEDTKFFKGLAQYLTAVQSLDPHLPSAEVFQAGRNVITANALQMVAGAPIESHSAIIGYSLLYPYTDNFLDDNGKGMLDQVEFAERLRARLSGEEISSRHPEEEKIFAAVGAIEKKFPRSENPNVYRALLTIHKAQVESQKRQSRKDLSRVDVNDEFMRRFIAKGGSSVLTDAFLVDGKPSIPLAVFAFKLGVALQFVDDLQDASRDHRQKQASMFSVALSKGHQLDDLALQTLNYNLTVISQMPQIASSPEKTASFQKQLKTGVYYLIAEAVNTNYGCYSEYFRSQLFSRLPIGLQWSRETVEQRFIKYHKANRQKLIDVITLA